MDISKMLSEQIEKHGEEFALEQRALNGVVGAKTGMSVVDPTKHANIVFQTGNENILEITADGRFIALGREITDTEDLYSEMLKIFKP